MNSAVFWSLRSFVSGACVGSSIIRMTERGVEFKGVAVTTETAVTAKTVRVASLSNIL